MPSPKNGQAGSLVPPAKPKQALEADQADPGEVEEVKSDQIKTGTGKYGSMPIKALSPNQSADDDGPEKQAWIEIELVDEEGKPVAGEGYSLTLPDGQTVAAGTLDEKGCARLDGIDPGSCKVTFPRLDQKAWTPS